MCQEESRNKISNEIFTGLIFVLFQVWLMSIIDNSLLEKTPTQKTKNLYPLWTLDCVSVVLPWAVHLVKDIFKDRDFCLLLFF